MSDDLIPFESGGELAPLSAPDLQVDTWTVPAPDFLSESYSAPASTVFGQPLAPGATPESVQRNLHELTQVFQNDMVKLGISWHFTSAAAQWFVNSATQPPPHEHAVHHYNLSGYRFPATDQPYITSFLNEMARAGASEKEVKTALWWVNQLGKVQGQPQHQRQQAATIDSLTDREYQIVKARAAKDLANAEAILKRKYGDRYPQVMAVVQAHVKNLPAVQRDFLETAVCQGGMLLANAPETVERLYAEAIGKTINPGNLAGEIAAIEQVMKTDRRRYNADPVMQERLRALYQMRDGG